MGLFESRKRVFAYHPQTMDSLKRGNEALEQVTPGMCSARVTTLWSKCVLVLCTRAPLSSWCKNPDSMIQQNPITMCYKQCLLLCNIELEAFLRNLSIHCFSRIVNFTTLFLKRHVSEFEPLFWFWRQFSEFAHVFQNVYGLSLLC